MWIDKGLVDPVGHLEMLVLKNMLDDCDDSRCATRGVFFGVPCLTLRNQTEWNETVVVGWNVLVGADPARILAHWTTLAPPADRPPIFGDGHAGQRIADVIDEVSL
jgi:UDP-N-acetylglucosamine 2-epimerase